MNRRELLIAAAAVAGYARRAQAKGRDVTVPNSSGSAPPKFVAPQNACDCHHHIYDGRFPVSPHWKQGFPEGATVADYRLLQQRLGTTRSVAVQPSTYGIDNRCLVDALGQLGANARGVAVVDPSVSDEELGSLTKAGVRAVRVNFVSPQTWGKTTPDILNTLARKISAFGWHAQILMTGEQITEHESIIRDLPCDVVIDHLGRIPEPDGMAHPGYAAVRRLLDNGRTWIKVTEPYEDSKLGAPYADTGKVAASYVKAAPERVLWGTDWPHPTQRSTKPDDALLLDLLVDWAGDNRIVERILVGNPEKLFGF